MWNEEKIIVLKEDEKLAGFEFRSLWGGVMRKGGENMFSSIGEETPPILGRQSF